MESDVSILKRISFSKIEIMIGMLTMEISQLNSTEYEKLSIST